MVLVLAAERRHDRGDRRAPRSASSSIPLSASRPAIRSAISSPVAPATVRKRQCSISSSPRKAPRWVWVLPTSTASSMAPIMAGIGLRRVDAKLYVIPGSHPSRTATAMLELKGIPYKRVDLMPVISKGALRAAGFPGITVPALKIDGRKVQGSREIARELDRTTPEPPLFPADPAASGRGRAGRGMGRRGPAGDRAPGALERAAARPRAARLLLRGRAARGPDRARGEDRPAAGRALGALQRGHRRERPRRPRGAARDARSGSTTGSPRACSAASEPNAADLQIATSVRLLMTLQDLREPIAARPAGELAMRVAPDYPGDAPPILPPAWLEPLRAAPATSSA